MRDYKIRKTGELFFRYEVSNNSEAIAYTLTYLGAKWYIKRLEKAIKWNKNHELHGSSTHHATCRRPCNIKDRC